MSRVARYALSLLLALAALSAQARLFLWDAEQDGKHIWLLGSIHLGRPDMYPLAAPIEKAYRAADTLVVEADIDDASAMMPLMSMTLLPAGQTVGAMLTPKQSKALDGALAEAGLPRAAAEHMKPWFLSLSLSALGMRSAGLKPELGIDMHYLKAAKQDGKKVVELESAKEQFEMLDQLAQEDEVAMLDATIDPQAGKHMKAQLAAMVRAWQHGDVKAMRKVIDDDAPADNLALKRVNDRLFGTRNRAMVEKIIALAGAPAPLVVVGAGHLAGPDNLIDMLKARGFHLTQY